MPEVPELRRNSYDAGQQLGVRREELEVKILTPYNLSLDPYNLRKNFPQPAQISRGEFFFVEFYSRKKVRREIL